MTRVRLAIVHPKRLVREGLQGLLARSRCTVAAAGGCASDTLADPATIGGIDVVLLALTDDRDADAQLAALRGRRSAMPQARFVVLTDLPGREVFQALVDAGVDAVLSKDISADVLQHAVQLVLLGHQFFPRAAVVASQPADEASSIPPAPATSATAPPAAGPPPPQPTLARQDDVAVPSSVVRLGHRRPVPQRPSPTGQDRGLSLSERERQILACLGVGAPNKVIARELQIAEATVKVHVKGLLRKLRVTNRTQAAIWALDNADGRAAPPGAGTSPGLLAEAPSGKLASG